MNVRCFLAAAIIGLSLSPPRAVAECRLGRLAELPVTMMGMRPTVAAKINGADAHFLVDSGAFYSLITPASAEQYHLHPLHDDHGQLFQAAIQGIGGQTSASVTSVSLFMLGSVPLRNLNFFIAGSEVGNGTAGILGQELLRIADVEYDLANGVIRLWHPRDCSKYNGAYWAGSQPYSVMDVNGTSPQQPHTIGTALLNDTEIRVMFDTGAQMSMVALGAAKQAGFTPDAPGVTSAGNFFGLGDKVMKAWIAPFASFKIGDEEIHNTHLRVADTTDILEVDMLLGSDFFLSHRIYVSTSQHEVFFTYNGGPVFNLGLQPPQHTAASASSTAPQPTAAEAAEPTDAAGFSRRGSAYAARGDLVHAIADLTRACELAPTEPDYFYQRGMARWNNNQPFLALDDFNRALKLEPGDVAALIARAELHLEGHDDAGVAQDLEAADRAAPKQADVRFTIGNLYTRIGRFAPAVAQYDLWIEAHAEGPRTPDAFNARCWARALWAQQLAKALGDCETALRLRPRTAGFLDARALVEQRLGKLDKSIDDYDVALGSEPKNAWLLYARGVAELHAGRKTAGEADIAAATVLQPRILEVGRERGLTP